MKTNEQTHTPTPWRIDNDSHFPQAVQEVYAANGSPVCNVYGGSAWQVGGRDAEIAASKENAAFIIRACNAHDELVAAIVEIITECNNVQHSSQREKAMQLIELKAWAALTKAKGGAS